jgi:hypothetical protein
MNFSNHLKFKIDQNWKIFINNKEEVKFQVEFLKHIKKQQHQLNKKSPSSKCL